MGKRKGLSKRVGLSIMAVLSMWFTACTTEKRRGPANELEPLPDGESGWSKDIDARMPSFISPPKKIPAFSRFLLGIAEREFDKELPPGRILTWSTNLGIASGALELYIEKGAGKILEPRMVYLVRMQVSFSASCPFAIDVNSAFYAKHSITPDEIKAMQRLIPYDEVASFSELERVALGYVHAATITPPRFDEPLLSDVRRLFTHEEIVALAALAAKVNYWARFIEAMRIAPIGYTDDPLLMLDSYRTFGASD